MTMWSRIKYIISKIIVYLQIPSVKNCEMDKTSKIGQKSSVLNVKIGRYSYIGRNNGVTNTEIGNYCSIGSFVTIGGGVHPLNRISTSPLFYDKGNDWKTSDFISKDNKEVDQLLTIVGNDVWIGDYSYIKAGVKIGDGVIIGAGAVVTKDVPPYSIVGGVPAKVIRYRFSEEIIERLLEIKWWDKDEKWLKDNVSLFSKSDLKINDLNCL